MGKIITINGANFSENACDVVEMFNHSIEDWDEYFSLKTNNYISAEGVWVSAVKNYYIITPLEGTRIEFDATENTLSWGDWTDGIASGKLIFAFFSERPINSPGDPAYGMIGNRISIDTGEKVTMDIPAGTKWLYLYMAYHSDSGSDIFTSYLPKAIYWK